MKTLFSILSMYKYDSSIFDDFEVPSGIDKDLLVDNLIVELAPLEILYSDPEFMKFAINAWSSKEFEKWQELYNTTQYEYDAIENFNRTEVSTDTETRNLLNVENEERDFTVTNGETVVIDSEVNNSGNDVVSEEVAGFNSEDLNDSKADTTTYGSKSESDNTTTTDQEGTDKGTSSNIKTDSGTVTNGRESNFKGNIGVTTTQQMIQQQRDVVEFNIYDYIIGSFKRRFCLMLW